jgi:alpha-beta hydrolase superfamily lysophospholipase
VLRTFRTFDGMELAYRAWVPAGAAGVPPTRAILLFHRGHEHSGRWEETVHDLVDRETALFALDQRGHGRSPGARGGAPNVAALIRDADCFARHIATAHGIPVQRMAVLAHSMGAVVAAGWVHDYAPPLRAMVLAAPALRVKLYVPLARPMLRLRQRVLGPGDVRSYVKAGMLTHDPREAALYAADPLIFRQIAVNVLLDLHDTSTRLLADAGAITVPTLIMSAGRDWVVNLDAQRRFFKSLGSEVKRLRHFPVMYHSMFHERGRGEVVAVAKSFMDECTADPAPRRSLVSADRGGLTRSEHDLLRLPGGSRWALGRGVLRSVGRLATGIDLGWRSGFDSGLSLDHVYRNRATGRGPTPIRWLGALIDRIYLNAPGWRGIRERRSLLESLLRECVGERRRQGQPVHIVDIAAGGGRYVIESVVALRAADPSAAPMTALLRDDTMANLVAARSLAAQHGLDGDPAHPDAVRVELGDAFDEGSLAALSPAPTIVIASGLFELFPENAPIRRALRGLAAAMPAGGGGQLIYTCQPWHPQLEFIARVLVNREGRPWIMRRRTQQEMDDLVAEAGFLKESQAVEAQGIFTVAVARR